MKPTAEELTGYNLVNADVLILTGSPLPKKLRTRQQSALTLMIFSLTNVFLRLAHIEKIKAGEKTSWSIREGAKFEHDYHIFSPILPTDGNEAKDLLRNLIKSCGKISGGKKVSKKRLEELHSFCHKFSAHLDKLRAERAGY